MLAALLLLPSLAFAQEAGPNPLDPASLRYGTTLDYADDLAGENRADRLFAARELYRRARSAAHAAEKLDEDKSIEGRADLADLREDVLAPAMKAVVDHAEIRAPLAGLLGELGDPSAVEPLRQALAAETRPRVQRRLQAAIDALVTP